MAEAEKEPLDTMNIQPVPSTRSSYRSNSTDYTQAPEAFAAAKHFAVKFFDLDPSGLKFSGFAMDTKSPLHVIVVSGDEVHREFYQDTVFGGELWIEPDTHDPKHAIRRDVIGDIQTLWLRSAGYPADFPTGVECTVHGDQIDIRVTPCN